MLKYNDQENTMKKNSAIGARLTGARKVWRSCFALALPLALAGSARAADIPAVKFVSAAGTHLWLSGNSTFHPYESTSTLTEITAGLAPDADRPSTAPVQRVLEDIARRAPFQRFDVVIPVRGLKSGESLLDKNLYKALKAKDFPEIRFSLQSYRTSPAGEGDAIPFEAVGLLFISGVQKPVTLNGTARVQNDQLRVDGDYDLLMTDYGVKPPTLFLGAIKVADPVEIHFRLVFEVIVR